MGVSEESRGRKLETHSFDVRDSHQRERDITYFQLSVKGPGESKDGSYG